MAESGGPGGPDATLATAVDTAAAALLSIWDTAREQTSGRLSSSQLGR